MTEAQQKKDVTIPVYRNTLIKKLYTTHLRKSYATMYFFSGNSKLIAFIHSDIYFCNRATLEPVSVFL